MASPKNSARAGADKGIASSAEIDPERFNQTEKTRGKDRRSVVVMLIMDRSIRRAGSSVNPFGHTSPLTGGRALPATPDCRCSHYSDTFPESTE